MDKRWLIVVIFVTYLIHEVWVLIPASDAVFKFFPFSDQAVSAQYYVFMSCKYLILVLFMVVIYQLYEEERQIMRWFVAFQVLEFFEYHLTYNEPVFHINILNFPVGINITNIKVVVMFVLVSSKIIREWNLGK